MPKFEQYRHKGAVFQVSIPLEWDDFDDYIEFDGIKFSKMVNLIGFFEVFGRKDYEFGGLNDCIFIDVGANVADSTLFAAKLSNVKKVYAYEPFPEVYKVALKNIELNPELKNKIQLSPTAWYSKNGRVSTDEVNDINASAINTFLSDFAQPIKSDKLHRVQIEIRRASEILKEIINENNDSNIVLKMDIEGAEYECFKDLDKSGLLKNIRQIFVEWHNLGHEQITKILEKHGFVWMNENLGAKVGFIRAIKP